MLEATGKAMLYTDNMQIDKVLAAVVSTDVSLQSGLQPCL